MKKTEKEINKNLGDGSLFYNLKKRTVSFILLIFMFIGVGTSFAEVATIKSPLSWYEGGSGDYALPKLTSAEYELNSFAATAGQIETLCVNYTAVGKVKVEVSADNGLHYYAVTNGVPLADNFVSGDRIKWRAKVLEEDAKLNAVKITYTDNVGTTAGFGAPELSGFNYRKEILLKNPSGQELFNYQINLKVGIDKKTKGADVNCEGNARQDFGDVRFTAADKETPLPYYLESRGGLNLPYSVDNPDALLRTFWVKVPQIPKEGVKIYIYYGNSRVDNLSDPKNTFDFFDNFKNIELDKNSWVAKIDPKGSSLVKDGQLKLDAAEIITKDFKFKQGVIEYSVAVESGFENSLNLRAKAGNNYDNPDLVVYSSAYKGAEHCIAIDDIVKANDAKASPISTGGKYNYRLTVKDKDIIFERFGDDTAVQAKVTYSGTAPVEAGYLGLKSGGDGSGRNVIVYSGIRARKFVDNAPQVDKVGAAEQVKLPIFSNLALSKKGSLILSNTIKEGIYIGKTIPAAFPVRIIVPTFKGINASLSVSADNGVNYKTDCLSGNYYYASTKDFTVGTKVVGKIKLIPNATSEFTELKLDYNPGTILMLKPNGAEVLSAAASTNILWTALEYDDKYPIKLEYSLDKGKTYQEIADKIFNSGTYLWQIPQDIKTQSALIRASDSNAAAVNDVSDNVFEIQGSELSSTDVLEGELKEIPASAGMTSESAGMTSESAGMTQEEQKAAEAKDEQAAQEQAKTDLSDSNRDYLLDANITISTDKDIAFKTLTLGDGIGKNTTRIILNNNINPGSGKIIIRNGGQLIQANIKEQVILGDLVIQQGGILTHLENKTEKKNQINLIAQNIILKTGANVSAYALGYSAGEARQAGKGSAGGKYVGKEASGGKHTYDTEHMPKELGSGGAGGRLAKGGAGGGVIKLMARNEFSISGIINADGKDGEVSADKTCDGAGGAGGSIYLSAAKFSGSGAKITATSGSGNKTAGGGGGGRINIVAPAGKISGTINSNGGKGFSPGKAGSSIVE